MTVFRNAFASRSLVRAGLVGLFLFGLVGAGTLTTVSASKVPTESVAPLVSKQRCAANRAAGPVTFVSPFDYDASAGIIDIVDAKQLGYFAQMCITVNIVVPAVTASPYELVAAGQGTVTGEGSAADTLVGTATGANLVAVATFGDTSDYALLTRPNITSLRLLDGKLLGYHTQLPVVLTEMLKKSGADLATIDEVNDTSYNPAVLFDAKPGFSGLQAYQSNEPLTLEAEGYKKGKSFLEWTPAQFGVQGTFNVQVFNGTFLKDHPATAADFMRAELHGLNYCLTNEKSCVDMEQTVATKAGYPGSLTHALAEWTFEAGLVRHHTLPNKGIGVETTAEWTPEAKAIVTYGVVKKAPSLAKVENTTLLSSLYHGTRLIWPGP